MSINKQLQAKFTELADGLDLLGASSFRTASHRRVARALGALDAPITELAEDPVTLRKRLESIPGIGKGAARRISEFVARGDMEDHREVLAKVPRGLFRLLEIPGLGPKAVRTLWTELGVESLADLRREIDAGTVAALPRMGRKTVENLRQSLEFASRSHDRLPIGQARPLAEHITAALRHLAPGARVEFAGSLRRSAETVGDLDFVAAHADASARDLLRRGFLDLPEVQSVLADGSKKCSARLQVGQREIQADLRLVEPHAFGAAWHYFTGSKEHNVLLRQIAIASHKRLNEYGLFDGTEERPQEQGAAPIAAADELSIFRALGLPYIPPEMREEAFDPSIIGLEQLESTLAALIDLDDIQADLHTHTNASDGRHALPELVDIARRRGLRTLAITDHSRSSALAGGLEIEDLLEHVAAIRALDASVPDLQLLAGAEVDILADGTLDYPDEVLAQLDIVVASPHASLQQAGSEATNRLLAAIRHPLVHIIGHPTGRIVGRRRGLEPRLDLLFEAAAACNTVLELNANPRRLDLGAAALRAALGAGCKIAINTDAHADAQFDYLSYGVQTARRAGMASADCINTWSPNRLRDWLAHKHRTAR